MQAWGWRGRNSPVPMTDSSWHKWMAWGTGTAVGPRADITRNSRDMSCADFNSWPGGFLRRTARGLAGQDSGLFQRPCERIRVHDFAINGRQLV